MSRPIPLLKDLPIYLFTQIIERDLLKYMQYARRSGDDRSDTELIREFMEVEGLEEDDLSLSTLIVKYNRIRVHFLNFIRYNQKNKNEIINKIVDTFDKPKDVVSNMDQAIHLIEAVLDQMKCIISEQKINAK